jgi:hypothetical protein
MSIRRVIQVITIAFALAFTFNVSTSTAYATQCNPSGTGGWC